MIKYSMDRKQVDSFDALLEEFSSDTYSSPFRSTLPLLDHWRTPADRLTELGRTIGATISTPVTLSFEYQVPVQKGKGKPSCTDLMIISEDTAIAVEAKYTEPMYESVETWLQDASSSNRIDVLNGWLELISGPSGRSLMPSDVSSIPYQMVHRLASVCSVPREKMAMVYVVYGGLASHYQPNMNALRELIGAVAQVQLFLLQVSVSPLSRQLELQSRWQSGDRDLAEDIKMSLKMGPIFQFAEMKTVAKAPLSAQI